MRTGKPRPVGAKPVDDFIQTLKGRMHVMKCNIAEVTKFLQDNHYKPARRFQVKDESFYKKVYSEKSIIIHHLDDAAVFFEQLDHHVLGSLRNIRIIVSEATILQHPQDVLHALQLLFACPPTRSMADTKLTATKMPPITMAVNPFSKKKSRKHASFPCFLVEGLVGLKLTLLVRRTSSSHTVTTTVIDRCLNQGVDLPKINPMYRLPREIRQMIYAYTIAPRGSEVIIYEGLSRADRTDRDLQWRDFLSMILVCRMMSAEVLNFAARRCKFTLHMQNPDSWAASAAYIRGTPTFRNIFKAVCGTLPGWILASFSEVEISFPLTKYLSVEEPLAPLLSDMLSKLRPKAQGISVQFGHRSTIYTSSTDFDVNVSGIPDLEIRLHFRTSYQPIGPGSPELYRFIAATLRSLEDNMELVRSHVDLAASSDGLVNDGVFTGAEWFSEDEEELLEADTDTGSLAVAAQSG